MVSPASVTIVYLDLFRGAPGMLRLTSLALIGRTPSGMAGIALVLLVERESASYSLAGLAAALFAGGAALGGVAYARLIARLGYAAPLVAGGILGGSTLAVVPTAVYTGSPPAYLGLITAAGLTFPPLAACVRSQWNRYYLDAEPLMRAATLESVVGEIAFLIGPLLVTLTVTVGSESLPFPLAGAMVGVAAIAFGRRAIDPPPDIRESPAHPTGLWRVGFVLTLLAGALWCVSFGTATVGLIAASDAAGRQHLSGVLVALISVGAVAGGLAFGARAADREPAALLVVVLAGYAVCLAPLTVAYRSHFATVPLLLLVGTTSAAVLACLNLRIVAGLPPAREVEAYGWLNGFTVAGLAVGPAIGGQLADQFGAGETFAAAAGIAATGALLARGGQSR